MVEETIHVLISGRVQGVWYRGWTKQHASENKLSGWVRNRSDGSVEAIFQGRPENLHAMLELCRIGPPAAEVRDIDVKNITREDFVGFRQLPTI